MIYYVVPATEDYTIRVYLDDEWGRALGSRMRIVHYEELPDRTRFERGTYIFTGLEHLTPAMMRLAAEIRRRLNGTPGFRFLNDPEWTLQRFALLTALYERGLNTFRAVRPRDDLRGLRYPVFLRSERWHNGPSTPLLRNRRELDRAIGRAAVRGGLQDLLVVEFCDTADSEGRHTKYSAFVVGDRVIARSYQRGPDWTVKFSTAEFSPEQAEKELAYVAANPHAEQLKEICALAGAEYGRIDFGVLDGRVQTWEINLNPTPGPGRTPDAPKPPPVEAIRRRTKERFYAAFHQSFEAVDEEGGGPLVTLDIDPRIADAARAPARERRHPGAALLRILRPARRALEPIAAPLLPLVGRLARRR